MLGARAWEMGNTPTLWETESSSNGASDCVGAVTNFFHNFPVCFRAAAIVCFMFYVIWESVSEITAETSSELLTRHEPLRGAGERGNFLSSFQNIFSPPLLFSEKCWPLVSRARLVICEISLSRQTDNDRLARLPLLLHHYLTKTGT